MDELEAISICGVATAKEVSELTGKSCRNTIKQLNRLDEIRKIKIIETRPLCEVNRIGTHRRLYVKREIYDVFG